MNTIFILIAIGVGQSSSVMPIEKYWTVDACNKAAASFNKNVPSVALTGFPRAIAFCMESGK